MKLGILVNTDKHLDDIKGIAEAAVAKGHEVNIFAMDAGTKLIGQEAYTGLCKVPGVKMSFCDQSSGDYNVSKDLAPEEITCGSQYDNAIMNSECDKVIVL